MTAFGVGCQQVDGNRTSPCSDYPSLFSCNFPTAATTTNYYNLNVGGYTTSGWLSDSYEFIYINNLEQQAEQYVNQVVNITRNVWNYGSSQDNCGSFGVSADSLFIKGLGNSTTSAMLLDMGPVTNQSFVNQSTYNGPTLT